MCLDLLQEANEICRDLGEDHENCKRARFLYSACEIARVGRMSDTRADDRMMALFSLLAEAHEILFGKLDIPPRPCGRASIDLRGKIFSNKKNAMVFSNKIAEAFKEAGIKLAKDETYACLVCAVKKPKYTSEALALDPLIIGNKEASRINYVMEPTIMKSVMRHIASDRIDY